MTRSTNPNHHVLNDPKLSAQRTCVSQDFAEEQILKNKHTYMYVYKCTHIDKTIILNIMTFLSLVYIYT